MNKKIKIVLITAGQPATNPRALKEAIALNEAGYDVNFLYCFWVDWGLHYDNNIIKENPGINWLMVGGNPLINKTYYNFTKIKYKFYRLLNKLFPKNILFAQYAAIRCFSSLLREALNLKANFYIAHNLGALSIAAIAAKENNSKYAFDAEDYHRGQFDKGSVEYNKTVLLENKYLPGASYITAASPLIGEQYINHYQKPVTVINNVFSLNFLAKEINEPHQPIKLFWFSQTIGKDRGIEDIVMAIKGMPIGEFSLTLLGKHDESIKNYFLKLAGDSKQSFDINFLHPVSLDKIFEISAQHDIGLALETGRDKNNNLALSNKIFSYMLAGNAIIFSDTLAQKKFFDNNNNIGSLYCSSNIAMLSEILQFYLQNYSDLFLQKRNSKALAETKFNWESESKVFLNNIERYLNY